MASARAPGDAHELCTLEPAPLPPNAQVLMDSYDYVELLSIDAAWQSIDLDDNNLSGSGTEVNIGNRLVVRTLHNWGLT